MDCKTRGLAKIIENTLMVNSNKHQQPSVFHCQVLALHFEMSHNLLHSCSGWILMDLTGFALADFQAQVRISRILLIALPY